jgi:hypothetical protein
MKNTWRHFVLFLHDAMGGGETKTKTKTKTKQSSFIYHISKTETKRIHKGAPFE